MYPKYDKLRAMEKATCIMNYSGERSDIALLISMDAPEESLEEFRKQLKSHMT